MPQARRVVTGTGRQQYGRYAPPPRRRSGRGPKVQIKLPWRWIALVVGIVLLVWFIWTRFTVKTVNVTTILRSQEVKSELQAILVKDPRQGNLITLNTSKLATSLTAIDPGLRDIHISRRWPSTIVVDATQKQPALGWSTGGQKYLLDKDGTIIGVFPDASKLMLVVDGSNLPAKVGQKVVTTSFVSFCDELLNDLSSAGVTVTGLRVQDTTFDLYVQTGKPYQLIFDTTRPAADEVADLKTVLKTLGTKQPLQYIDMRISGKAYYK